MLAAILAAIAVMSPVYATDLPALARTRLYTHMAQGCVSVALATWNHPARQVFERNKVKVQALALCNRGHYPIFRIAPPYDPRTDTASFFHPLYAALARANGYWSYALVDSTDGVVIMVDITSSHDLHLTYEDYAAVG